MHYPDLEVELSNRDGNIFAIIGRICNVMKRNGVKKNEINKFIGEVTSCSSYDKALSICNEWVNIY